MKMRVSKLSSGRLHLIGFPNFQQNRGTFSTSQYFKYAFVSQSKSNKYKLKAVVRNCLNINFIYLKGKKSEQVRPPQSPKTRAEPGQHQKPRTPTWSSMSVA